jgi:uncharacterized protein (TIGR02246 family)
MPPRYQRKLVFRGLAASPTELLGRLADAISNGELKAAVALWEPEACIVGPDGSTLARGRDALEAVLGALVERDTQFEAAPVHVWLAGDVALVASDLTLTAPDGTVQRSRALVVHRRGADGCWRIAVDAPWGLPDETGGPYSGPT